MPGPPGKAGPPGPPGKMPPELQERLEQLAAKAKALGGAKNGAVGTPGKNGPPGPPGPDRVRWETVEVDSPDDPRLKLWERQEVERQIKEAQRHAFEKFARVRSLTDVVRYPSLPKLQGNFTPWANKTGAAERTEGTGALAGAAGAAAGGAAAAAAETASKIPKLAVLLQVRDRYTESLYEREHALMRLPAADRVLLQRGPSAYDVEYDVEEIRSRRGRAHADVPTKRDRSFKRNRQLQFGRFDSNFGAGVLAPLPRAGAFLQLGTRRKRKIMPLGGGGDESAPAGKTGTPGSPGQNGQPAAPGTNGGAGLAGKPGTVSYAGPRSGRGCLQINESF